MRIGFNQVQAMTPLPSDFDAGLHPVKGDQEIQDTLNKIEFVFRRIQLERQMETPPAPSFIVIEPPTLWDDFCKWISGIL